jgi:sn-glycerol 3-phosphate transport system permease protein
VGGARPDYLAHGILCLGVILFALPVWLAIAGSTQNSGAVLRGALRFLPGSRGPSAYIRVLTAGGNGTILVWHMLLISSGMALVIALGKITVSILSAFAVVFCRFTLRRTAFWVIFVTLMLPVEVRIIPPYAVMADLHLINTFTGPTIPHRLRHRNPALPPDLNRHPRRTRGSRPHGRSRPPPFSLRHPHPRLRR